MMVPPRQECLQHAGSRGLADGDAARHANDEGNQTVRMLVAEEGRRRGEQPLPGGHLQVDQPCQRQIDLGDFGQVDLLAQTTQADQLFFGKDQWRGFAQRAPLFPVELHVGARLAQPRHERKSCRSHS
ncbi:Uncharacterised protein [Mycobacteroides abscessus]|nr:Uncharacterised protein [Mycobacteroides abscessus]SHV71017.1 Uncharacterised protein [Mycobacteroides abscessus subsp. abscessus]